MSETPAHHSGNNSDPIPLFDGSGDPVSWLEILPGWSVVSSDGATVGTVLSVTGDKQEDIFDGLAINVDGAGDPRYVPGEKVGAIFTGRVTIRLSSAEAAALAPYVPDKPETVWRPSGPSIGQRISNFFGGRRPRN